MCRAVRTPGCLGLQSRAGRMRDFSALSVLASIPQNVLFGSTPSCRSRVLTQLEEKQTVDDSSKQEVFIGAGGPPQLLGKSVILLFRNFHSALIECQCSCYLLLVMLA